MPKATRKRVPAGKNPRKPGVSIQERRVVWAPQAGSQVAFLECPMPEVLYHGTRGPGKTDALLMSFAQHVGKGYGAAWRGILFRQTYKQLEDVVAKSQKWFPQIFPEARFNRGSMRWEWPSGEVLLFRHMARSEDYRNYHGHEYPFIAWEELTNWPDPSCFTAMMSCNRSSSPGVPRIIRATTNPYGVGHNWVKRRYSLHGDWSQTKVIRVPGEPIRVAIHGHLDENRILLDADPTYRTKILAGAANPAMVEAWLKGSWDIVAGGMFDDVWSPKHSVVKRFEIPESWRVDRSFDWGSSAPFSVGWWAQSDGTDYVDHEGNVRSTVAGDLFRIHEWYGSTGRPNEGLKMLAIDVAKGILERERTGLLADLTVHPGPADSAIYAVENGVSIAKDMDRGGVRWLRADKSPGSRKTGWEMVRKMMSAAKTTEESPVREKPGLFVFDHCDDFLQTVPPAPRKKKDPDDLDTDSEDHIADEVRYRVRSVGRAKPRHGGVSAPGMLGPRLIEG